MMCLNGAGRQAGSWDAVVPGKREERGLLRLREEGQWGGRYSGGGGVNRNSKWRRDNGAPLGPPTGEQTTLQPAKGLIRSSLSE